MGEVDNDRSTFAPASRVAQLLNLRLGIGLAQGLMAWALLEMLPKLSPIAGPELQHWWPYRHPAMFAAMTLLTAFVPVVALAGVGRMRARRLAVYLLLLAAALAALAGHDIWRDPLEAAWRGADGRIWPSATLIFCGGVATFITNQLLEHHERGAGLWAAYADHFEDSWMRGFQFVLALVFTLLVWGVLELGRALFGLIHLDWFGRMIEHNWFRCPVLAMAFAASVHITDVRPALLNGMRNLGLTLLSWLLPLVVVLGWGFLLALVFTGLAPLWGTRFAGSILLWAVAVTLVLVNAAYKDGIPEHAPPAPIRWAGRAAAPMMLLLTMLAVYAVAQRVGQYGWTPMRLRSAMVAAIALVYSAGYTRAAILKGPWLKGIERINVAASLGIVAVLALKLTPLADPARVSTNSQVARLTSGKLTPDKFDYQFLRWDAGVYGTQALATLAGSPVADVASRARLALAGKNRVYFNRNGAPDPAATEPPLAHARVFPEGARLPASFRAAKWASDEGDDANATCLTNGAPCDIIVLPAGGRASPTLLILEGDEPADRPASADQAATQVALQAATRANNVAPLFGQDTEGEWRRVGTLSLVFCPGVRDALRHGRAVPVRPTHEDMMANGLRLPFTPDYMPSCPSAPKPVPQPKPASSDASAPAAMGPAFGRPGGL